MIFSLLPLVLPFLNKLLGNSILGPILGWLQSRNDTKAAIYAKEVEFLIEQNKARKEVLLRDAEHPLLWIPKFILFITVVAWVAGVFIDSLFNFSWDVLDVPEKFWWIVYSVVGYMTLDTATRNLKR